MFGGSGGRFLRSPAGSGLQAESNGFGAPTYSDVYKRQKQSILDKILAGNDDDDDDEITNTILNGQTLRMFQTASTKV